MPKLIADNTTDRRHSDDIQDIISAPPSWSLKWGTTLFLIALSSIIVLTAFIRYPDIVKTPIKIESPNTPKSIVTKLSGRLIKLLVKENDLVVKDQPLAFMESTGNHQAILNLLAELMQIQQRLSDDKLSGNELKNSRFTSQLGELQVPYQTFFQDYLSFRSAIDSGFYLKKKTYLQNDLININQQRDQLNLQKDIQQKDYELANQEYEVHKKLEQEKVETTAEYRDAQSKFLSKKSPLIQTETSLIVANGSYAAKQKEILELDNEITQEKAKFTQSLNSLVSQAEDWRNKYILSASQSGKISFAGIVQENEVLTANQEVFYINPGNELFFGEMSIPQDNMGKVKVGQEVLIKLKSYPFEQYGLIRGKINYISDVPFKDSIFISKVAFNIKGRSDMLTPIRLKQGMSANAEIITQDATVLQRITWDVTKLITQK